MIPIADALRSKDAGPMVYRLYGADSELLYVGATKRTLQSRLRGHRSDKEWWTEVAFVTFEVVVASDLAAAEKRAIRDESPACNRIGGDGRMTPAERAEIERQGAEYARRSRRTQGLPEQVEDPTFYAALARLLAVEDRATATPRSAA